MEHGTTSQGAVPTTAHGKGSDSTGKQEKQRHARKQQGTKGAGRPGSHSGAGASRNRKSRTHGQHCFKQERLSGASSGGQSRDLHRQKGWEHHTHRFVTWWWFRVVGGVAAVPIAGGPLVIASLAAQMLEVTPQQRRIKVFFGRA